MFSPTNPTTWVNLWRMLKVQSTILQQEPDFVPNKNYTGAEIINLVT